MRTDRICRIAVVGLGILLVICYWMNPFRNVADKTVSELARSVLLHLIGTAIFAFVLIYLRIRVWKRIGVFSLAVLIPAFVIAWNNFPWIGLLRGSVRIDRPEWLWLLALDALFIGAFEEMAFRGALLPLLLKKYGKTKCGMILTVVISSAVFGAVHLLNLIERAGVGATFLQVGYSFLIGGMCAIVYLRTGNLIACILIHAIYDLGGALVPTLGSGTLWDRPTVILTVVVSVAVAVWMLYLLFELKPQNREGKEDSYVTGGDQSKT